MQNLQQNLYFLEIQAIAINHRVATTQGLSQYKSEDIAEKQINTNQVKVFSLFCPLLHHNCLGLNQFLYSPTSPLGSSQPDQGVVILQQCITRKISLLLNIKLNLEYPRLRKIIKTVLPNPGKNEGLLADYFANLPNE